MTFHIPIDPPETARTQGRPDEADQPWLCSFCGLVRIPEGGCPRGRGREQDCRDCGARISTAPKDLAAIAKGATKRRDSRALIEAGLL
jgi:hypothetical protein